MRFLSVLQKIKRPSAVALGVGVALAQSALADTYASKCAGCVSTTDFSTYARKLAHQIDQNGTGSPAGYYVLSSDGAASSAFMSVTGSYVIKNKDVGPVWVTSAVTPVDFLGNSLAAQSESVLQTVYHAQDTIVIGSDRTDPVILPQIGGNIPAFETHTDQQIEQAVAAWQASVISTYPENMTLQLTFNNGTTASFTVNWSGPKNDPRNFHLIYIPHTAKDKTGKPIDHQGHDDTTPLKNKSTVTPDGGGGGGIDLPGLASGQGFDWKFTDHVPSGTGYIDGPIVETVGGAGGGAQFISYF